MSPRAAKLVGTSARFSLVDAALAVAAAFCGYVLLEAAYRSYQYRGILDEIVTAATVQIPTDGQASSVFDPFTGYRYRPNIEVGPAMTPFPVHYRTNSHGLIAREDFPVAKPAGEYRVGVVGDSFTANVTSTLRWTDIVEDALNASAEWQAIAGGRRTRVINFGLDGIGTAQFGDVVEHVTPPFELDLLIVNMIKNDLIRKPHIRGHHAAISRQDISDHVRQNIMNQLNWFEIFPEVPAVVAGPRLGLSPRLTMRAIEAVLSKDIYYASAGEAVAAAAPAIETVLEHYPTAVFLLDTTYPEYMRDGVPEPTARLEEAAFSEIRAQFPSIRWTNVLEGARAPKSSSEVETWFNTPNDQHKNDVGVRIYGTAVAAFLTVHQKPTAR